jgi:hypothetical protein
VDEIGLSFDDGDQTEFPTGGDNDLRKAACLSVPDDHERDASIMLWNQMQPEPRSNMSDPNFHDSVSIQPILNDALSYLDQVQAHYIEQPDVYKHFLDIMKDFKSGAIDTPGIMARVCHILAGNAQLINRFNTFLPTGYLLETGPEAGFDDPDIVRVTTPMSTTIQSMLHPFQDSQATASIESTSTDDHMYAFYQAGSARDLTPQPVLKTVQFRLCDIMDRKKIIRSGDIKIDSYDDGDSIINAVRNLFGLLECSINFEDTSGDLVVLAPERLEDGMIVIVNAFMIPLWVPPRDPELTTETVLFHVVNRENPSVRTMSMKLDISSDDTADSILARVRGRSGLRGDIEFVKDGNIIMPTFKTVYPGMVITALGGDFGPWAKPG